MIHKIAKNIFITATNTDIGKTHTTLKLIKELSKMGYKVGVFKPIETGVIKTPIDGAKLLKTVQKYNKNFKNFTVNDIVPIQYRLPASPFVAKNGQKIDFEKIKKSYKKIAKKSDIVLIEGAGGLNVPLTKKFFMIDLIKFFNAKTLLITPSKLGCINDTLLSISALKNKKLKFIWCVNLYQDKKEFKEISLPFYKSKFKKILYLQNDINLICKELLKK